MNYGRGHVLDLVGNGGLHAVEEEKAAEKNENYGQGRSEQKQAGSLAAAGDGPAEAVNDAGHGIKAIEPAPARGDKRGGVSDGRGEHPECDDEGDDVADVAIERVEGGEPEADAEGGEEREKEKSGKPESGECGNNAIGEAENREDYKADGKVHKTRKNGRNGENEAREIDFGDEVLAFDDDVGGGGERGSEIGPGDERGEIKDGVREAVGGQLRKAAEKESEDEHVENGLQDDPEDADGGLFVADLDVAPDEEVKQLAVGPDFAETQLEEAAGRLNADGRRGASVGRERSRLWRCRKRSEERR